MGTPTENTNSSYNGMDNTWHHHLIQGACCTSWHCWFFLNMFQTASERPPHNPQIPSKTFMTPSRQPPDTLPLPTRGAGSCKYSICQAHSFSVLIERIPMPRNIKRDLQQAQKYVYDIVRQFLCQKFNFNWIKGSTSLHILKWVSQHQKMYVFSGQMCLTDGEAVSLYLVALLPPTPL